jgi:hypothetical protein
VAGGSLLGALSAGAGDCEKGQRKDERFSHLGQDSSFENGILIDCSMACR